MTTHALYRFFDDTGQLLYIGITMNPSERFKQHRGEKAWWEQVANITVQKVSDRAAALAAETVAIKHERPKYNVVHNEAVTCAPITNPDALYAAIYRLMFVARAEGGRHVEVLAESAQRKNLNPNEANLVAWTEWTDHHLTRVSSVLASFLELFPFDRVSSLRQVALAELIASGDGACDTELLTRTAWALVEEVAKEHLAAAPPEVAAAAIAKNTFAGDDIDWVESATSARGWSWYGHMSIGSEF